MTTPREPALAITAISPGVGIPNGFSGRYAHFLRAMADDFTLDVVPLGRSTLEPLGDSPDYPKGTRVWSTAEVGNGRTVGAWERLALPVWAQRRPDVSNMLRAADFRVAVGFHYRSADVLLALPRQLARVAVLEEHDASLTHQSWSTDAVELAEVLRERLLFRRVCRQVDAVVAISEAEAEKWRVGCDSAAVTVIPHSVDCDFFRPRNAMARFDVGFFGMLTTGRDAGALWAANALVAAGVTKAQGLAFVGAAPSTAVAAWGRAGSHVTGRVADMREWYPQATVVVAADVSGPGVKTTVLEAWAMSRPVVATRHAMRGLPARDGENVLLIADERQLRQAVRALLGDADLAARIGADGMRTVRAERNLGDVRGAFRQVCQDARLRRGLLSQRGARPT